MNIPLENAWEIGIAVFGFIFGALWGHYGAIIKRVTHEECSKKRDNCPCKQQIEEMEEVVLNMQLKAAKEEKKEMKNAIVIITVIILILLMLCGCRNTITHYDKKGKVIKVEEVTNLSRIADGTNSKSQMILIEGTYISSDFSATAGEGYIPGWVIKFANGKTAIINAKDNKEKFTGTADVVEKFFSNYEVTKDGVKQ